MHKYSFFLSTLSDIENKMSGSKHDLIRACGLLRQLFLDDTNLAHLINKEFKHKLVFRVSTDISDLPYTDGLVLAFMNIEPGPFKAEEISLDKFLARKCAISNHLSISVKVIILTCANVFGGIHFGTPSNDLEREIAELIDLDNNNPPLNCDDDNLITIIEHSVIGICRVALEALSPLRIDVLNKLNNNNPST